MSNENHRATANCLVFSFDLLKFECADTFSRGQKVLILAVAAELEYEPETSGPLTVQLCDPQELYTCRGWSCRRPQGSFEERMVRTLQENQQKNIKLESKV